MRPVLPESVISLSRSEQDKHKQHRKTGVHSMHRHKHQQKTQREMLQKKMTHAHDCSSQRPRDKAGDVTIACDINGEASFLCA